MLSAEGDQRIHGVVSLLCDLALACKLHADLASQHCGRLLLYQRLDLRLADDVQHKIRIRDQRQRITLQQWLYRPVRCEKAAFLGR